MTPVGINRFTGEKIEGFDHVVQCLFYLFSLHITSRMVARTVGSAVPRILGRENVTIISTVRFWTAIILACELWEPRFRISQVIYPLSANDAAKVRKGQLGIRLRGQYRPNALFGDFTVEPINGERDFII
jgi:hypothetical protein